METTSTIATEPATIPSVAVAFPSVEWFRRLADLMHEDRALHEHLGYVDCVAGFTVLDGAPNGGPWHVHLTFDGLEVTAIREVDETDLERADFVVESDLGTWSAMIRSIAEGDGRPALDQTLNYLSLPGTPIRIRSDDPVRRDLFFRFNQSLQEFLNASARFRTVFPKKR